MSPAPLEGMPDNLFRSQLWGSTVRGPVVRGQLIGVDLPEQYAQSWRVICEPLLAGGGGLDFPVRQRADDDNTFATIIYGDHRGGGMSSVEFTWPLTGCAFNVYGSSVALLVDCPPPGGNPLGDPVYRARLTPAGGAAPSHQGLYRALTRTFVDAIVQPLGKVTFGSGVPSGIGPPPSSQKRSRFPAKATHLWITCDSPVLIRLPNFVVEWWTSELGQHVSSLQISASPNRNTLSCDMPMLQIPPNADTVVIQNSDNFVEVMITANFVVEP